MRPEGWRVIMLSRVAEFMHYDVILEYRREIDEAIVE